jgi:hypothetical protein
MKHYVSKWTLDTFKRLDKKPSWKNEIRMTEVEFKYVKKSISGKIDKLMIASGVIESKFTKFGVSYTHIDLKPEQRLIEALYSFILDYKNEASLPLTEIEEVFGISPYRRLNGDIRFFSPESIEQLYSKAEELFLKDLGWSLNLDHTHLSNTDLKTLELYSQLFSEINAYSKSRSLELFKPDSVELSNDYDNAKWKDERVKGYHVVFHLCRFLGFDPLFFEVLDKNIFINGEWARHHFRDSFLRKTSCRVSDTILTDNFKHKAYEQFSEGFIVAIMNSLLEAIYMEKGDISESILKTILEKNMKKYLADNGGFVSEGDSVDDLVSKVFSMWKKGDFDNNIKVLNTRRKLYLSTKDGYSKFLEAVYDIGQDSRFIKNAKDFHVLLLNEDISGKTRDLYATREDFDYMRLIFSGGASQTFITDFIYLFQTQSSGNIHVEYVNWLEKIIWKI